MRPNTAIAERQGDLGGEKVQMTFDQNSLAHLMSVLTDLYSDPELACIREYSTNAYDAQREAGVVRPIEVTTPNQLSPFFRVKDFGIGMNASDIKEIYSQYGASTKRDSDDQVGMLGLGCKSALTYTNSFTVSAVKNNVKTLVVVSRSEDGSGVMEILSEAESDEPNGVEIIIPVKSFNSFEYKANQFFRFWEEDTVLLNGKSPERISGRAVSDSMIIVPGLGADFIVMGNVPYVVATNYDISSGRFNRNGVVARVKIGDVSFTPSREALHYTLRTKETIKSLQEEYKNGVKNALTREVTAAENNRDALITYIEWAKILYGNVHRAPKFAYQGQDIPLDVGTKNYYYNMNSSRYAVQEGTRLYFENMIDIPVIQGFPSGKVSSHQREKIRLWADKTGIKSRSVILVSEVPDIYTDWLGDESLYSWDDVKAVKKDRPKVERRENVQYDVYREKTGNQESLSKKDFRANVTPVLATAAEVKTMDWRWFRAFGEIFPDVMIVKIAANRWDKFRRDFGQTQSMRDFIVEQVKKSNALLTKEDHIYMNMDWTARRFLPLLNETLIDDDELSTFIKVTRQNRESSQLTAYKRLESLCSVAGICYDEIEYDGYTPFVVYPLLSGLNEQNDEVTSHAIIYVNAVYNSK